MKEYTNIKIRELLESDAQARAAIRDLLQNTGDKGAWVKAVRAARRLGKVIRVYPRSSRPTSASFYVLDVDHTHRSLVTTHYYEGPFHSRRYTSLHHILNLGIKSIELEDLPEFIARELGEQ